MKLRQIRVLLLAFMLLASFSTPLLLLRTTHAQNPVYYSVDPIATPPLTDTNASVNGLETPATPSPVGQNFTVEIHLVGATVANVPNGVAGVEVHLFFGNMLNYCQPTGFTDYIGQTNGVLGSGSLEGLPAGFYLADGATRVTKAPFTDAVYYQVSAASTSGGWNGNDGLVAVVNFTIIKQPQSSSGEPTVTLPLVIDFTDLEDALITPITHDTIQGTVTIDATPSTGAKYSLTINTVGNGTVTENPMSSTYSSGTNVTLTAVPGAGSTFTGWSGALTGTQNPTTVTMNANKTVTATFTQTVTANYTLTVNIVGNGTVTENPHSSTYLSGTVVTLTAVPGLNWTFTGWSGDLTGTQNPVSVTMNTNKNITATFVQGQVTYTLTINVVYVTNYNSLITSGKLIEDSSIAATPNASSYLSGTVVNLSVMPGLNWTFWGWSGDLTGNAASITMTKNSNITATFGLIWDFNHDGSVTLQDLMVMAKAWHSTPSSPNWNPQCDLAKPFNLISLTDLTTLAMGYDFTHKNTG